MDKMIPIITLIVGEHHRCHSTRQYWYKLDTTIILIILKMVPEHHL